MGLVALPQGAGRITAVSQSVSVAGWGLRLGLDLRSLRAGVNVLPLEGCRDHP